MYGIQGDSLSITTTVQAPQSYEVNGKTYTTQGDEAKSYSKEGTASYYHHKFNGRKTANGERYNSALFTAAHKTLPLNSYAVVTNLHNNRKVIVRINDRGPFSEKRIIDLSHSAAKELGLIARGTDFAPTFRFPKNNFFPSLPCFSPPETPVCYSQNTIPKKSNQQQKGKHRQHIHQKKATHK